MDSNHTEPETVEDSESTSHVDLEDSIVHALNKKEDRVPSTVNRDISARLNSEQNRYVYIVETWKTYAYLDGMYEERGESEIRKLL